MKIESKAGEDKSRKDNETVLNMQDNAQLMQLNEKADRILEMLNMLTKLFGGAKNE